MTGEVKMNLSVLLPSENYPPSSSALRLSALVV